MKFVATAAVAILGFGCGTTAKTTCAADQQMCSGVCTTTLKVNVTGTLVDVVTNAAVTNANMGINLVGLTATGSSTTLATTTVASGGNGSYTFSGVDVTCAAAASTSPYAAIAAQAGPATASDPIVPTLALIALAVPKADVSAPQTRILTTASATSVDTDLGFSGAEAIETQGVAFVIALDSTGTPVSGVTATSPNFPNAVISYPALATNSSGSATDASGLIVVTGAVATAAGPAFVNVTAPGAPATETGAPIIAGVATTGPVLVQ